MEKNFTKKLFDIDSHQTEFEAEVLDCFETEKGYGVVLDQTCFFYEGGGQGADPGEINGIRVIDVQEKNGIIVHYLERKPESEQMLEKEQKLEKGKKVKGKIDKEHRLRTIKHHSGEHIVSGYIHERFGYDNIGFHLGDEYVTMDFNGSFEREDLELIEKEANRIIQENVAVNITYPSPDELKKITYRSKLDLEENVRIVEFEGYDVCACCAPHVKFTGEIGLIKIINHEKYKGGTRLYLLAGSEAFRDYQIKSSNISDISGLLSAKPYESFGAVCKLTQDLKDKALENDRLLSRISELRLREEKEKGEKNIIIFEPCFNTITLRNFINRAMEECQGIAAGFIGNDESGYNYIIGSKTRDLRELSKQLNEALQGRGGGQASMIQGSLKAKEEEIRAYVERL